MKKAGLLSLISGIILVNSVGFISAAVDMVKILNQWNDSGVFSYMLPFLLVFAMVYGILNKSSILGADAKGVNVILALALGLLSLFSPFPEFITRMAPNLAIGLSVLLAAMILLGAFMQDTEAGKTITYGLVAVGIIAFLVVTYSSFQGNWTGYNLWDQYGSALITLLILIGLIAAVVKFGGSGATVTARAPGR